MNDSTKIKVYKSFQHFKQFISALDEIKNCRSEDIREWGEHLKKQLDEKIIDLLKDKDPDLDSLQLLINNILVERKTL